MCAKCWIPERYSTWYTCLPLPYKNYVYGKVWRQFHCTVWVTVKFQHTFLKKTFLWIGIFVAKHLMGKIVPVLFNWAPRHQVVLGEWRYNATHSLTSALERGEWSASRPGRFTPRETDPGTHWIGSWVGPSARLDTVSKGKIPSPRQDSNPDHTIVQPVVSRYTDWPIPARGSTLDTRKVHTCIW
jgi:hypothetical protein